MTTATVTLADLVAVTAGRAQHVIEEDRNYVLFWEVPGVPPRRGGFALHARLTIRYLPDAGGYIATLAETVDRFDGNTHTIDPSRPTPDPIQVTVLERPAARFSFAKWTEFVRDARKAVRTLETSS